MRSPDEIAADCGGWASVLSRDHPERRRTASLLREAEHALSELSQAGLDECGLNTADDLRAEQDLRRRIQAERDALIAFLVDSGIYPANLNDHEAIEAAWDALPESVRQRIEAPDA